MKNKKIIKKLIDLYKPAITKCEQLRHLEEMKDYLKKHNLRNGVCYAAIRRLDVDIYNEQWIKRYRRDNTDYWWLTPSEATTKRDIIKSLKVRLKILKEEYERIKNKDHEKEKDHKETH